MGDDGRDDGGVEDRAGVERAGRLADLTVALSLATDLGTGQPLEQGLRTCWLSLQVAEALGLGPAERSCVYHVALLRFLGCTSDASEAAELAGGDDIRFNAVFAPMLNASAGERARFMVRHLGEDQPLGRRLGLLARAVTDPGGERRSLSAHCEAAARLAGRVGLPASVCGALAHAYERWDGTGHPDGLAGDAIPVAVRIVTVARDAELWAREAGWTLADEVLAHRRGRAYDPAVVDALRASAQAWLAGIGDAWSGADDVVAMRELTALTDELADVAAREGISTLALRPGRLAALSSDASVAHLTPLQYDASTGYHSIWSGGVNEVDSITANATPATDGTFTLTVDGATTAALDHDASAAVIQAALASRRHPQQAYRTCLGILGLAKRYSEERLEAACSRAHAAGICSYKGVKNILDARLEQLTLEGADAAALDAHANIRGSSYSH